MATGPMLAPQRRHLAGLLEAIQRCVYFLDASDRSIPWPLSGAALVAEHFNTLHELKPNLYRAAGRFIAYCGTQLSVSALGDDFTTEFLQITGAE